MPEHTRPVSSAATGPLHGVTVLDLSRILAGPTCTQLLGDLGAEVIKVERPGVGDDTRTWGPPFAAAPDGQPEQSAYYLAANRNKRSVTIDFSRPQGARLVKRLAAVSDVLIENFSLGILQRKGLGWDVLSASNPRLVYCSITGFGQNGPRAHERGYDAMVQAQGGIMSLTGEPDGAPQKVGVGAADLMCGMYACVAILAALRHRDATGQGQYIDLALYDTQLAWLANAALDYFVTGRAPQRHGNAHAQIVPYDVFPTADGHIQLSCGNDVQFARLAQLLGEPAWAQDPRYADNPARVASRAELTRELQARFRTRNSETWLAELRKAGVPCGPVRTLDQVFADPQTAARNMRIRMPSPFVKAGELDMLGNPLQLSASPVSYRRPPPGLGAHTDEVLEQLLGGDDPDVRAAREAGVL